MATAEFPVYYQNYLNKAGESDPVKALKAAYSSSRDLLKSIPEEKQEFRYAEGKWTPKEMIVHLMDSERVFAYRAMRFARRDEIELPGFDQDIYIEPSKANERSWKSILKEYKLLRKSTIALFKNFPQEALEASGVSNGTSLSVRHLGLIMAGHENHHMAVLKERYL